ncbi:MAG TPA: hypothetical protein PLF40_16630 [Kofleriaceae bacterium]|nr:hypothetical protein [Kofleriaceae bacterium]
MEGFGYTLVDATSKQIVTAYSGSSGPSFGGFDNKETRVAISALQRQLNLTKPTDCKLDYDEPEGARVAIGIRKGRPFFALLRTYED